LNGDRRNQYKHSIHFIKIKLGGREDKRGMGGVLTDPPELEKRPGATEGLAKLASW
jgi:hypothetical protein